MKENKIIRYDRSANKVIVKVLQDSEAKEAEIAQSENSISPVAFNHVMEQVYSVENFKNAWSQLNQTITNVKQNIKSLKQEGDKLPENKFTENELATFREMLAAVNSVQQKEQNKSKLEQAEEYLKFLQKEYNYMKPVMDKLPK